jgi:hypothetical protein
MGPYLMTPPCQRDPASNWLGIGTLLVLWGLGWETSVDTCPRENLPVLLQLHLFVMDLASKP